MSLLNEFSQTFVMMEKTRTADGEGGFVNNWQQGVQFTMPQAHESTIQAQVAEKAGTASTYYFLPDKSMSFDYHDVFKRVSDGQIFRVTSPSGEEVTPAMSALNRTKITAEKWVLT